MSSRFSSSLNCTVRPFEQSGEPQEYAGADVLSVIRFAESCEKNVPAVSAIRTTAATDLMPLVQVPMQALDVFGAAGVVSEIWRAGMSISHGQSGDIRYSYNDEILFGAIQLCEKSFETGLMHDPENVGMTSLQLATSQAYQDIFALTDALDYPHIFRFWNYLADINGNRIASNNGDGMERYRQFNMGRQDGFLSAGRSVTGSVPAASALGFHEGPLTVCFFAARKAIPLAIENPRQVSAYQYPEDYGPRSPTFSRASAITLGEQTLLFISGTASIVGHQTLHAGDVLAQTKETLVNINATVAEANRVLPQATFALEDFCYRVYVRHAKNVAVIDKELRRTLGPLASLTYLRADICRQDLLMEIEATASHNAAGIA